MDKSSLTNIPESYTEYINMVEDLPLNTAFENSLKQLRDINAQALDAKSHFTYATGKWTLLDVFQHLSDSERIFQYRALNIARKANTPLDSFDQDSFATHANANQRTIVDLLDEYLQVHRSSARLFSTFNNEMLLEKGICSGQQTSVLAIGYFILGHKENHFKVISEKYKVSLFS